MHPFSRFHLHTLSYRNHRKIAVIDGALAALLAEKVRQGVQVRART